MIKSNIALATATVVFFWASAFVGIRIGLRGYAPGALALLRFTIASISMIPLYFSVKHRRKIQWRELPTLFACGLIGIAIYSVALNYGEIHVPAGIASFIIGLIPVFTFVFASIFLQERLCWRAWLGLGISLIGMILIALGEQQTATMNWSVFFVFIATICGAVFCTIQKPLLRNYHPLEVTSYAMWFGTLALLIFLPTLLKQITTAPLASTLAAVYMGIFPAAIAYACWSYVLSKLPASQAAVYLYFMPFITLVIGFLLLGEIPVWLSIAGGIIAIIGALFVHFRKRKMLYE